MFTFLALFTFTLAVVPSEAPPKSPADLTGPWQLFVDDAGIAEKTKATRVYHAFEKAASNPVLAPGKPWEGSTVYLYGTVLPGEDGAGYRMWYHSWAEGEYHILYANSLDGLHWMKPNLGLVAYDGETNNNILLRRTKEDHNPQVIYTPWDPAPERRYKLMNWDYGRTPPTNTVSGYYGACSPDGIHWTDVPKNPVLRDPIGDVGNFTWDAHAARYIGYPKQFADVRGFRRRCVGFAETKDFESWPAPLLVLTPDEYDDRWAGQPGQHTDFYGLCGFAYESQYLGFLWIFRITGAGDDGAVHVELVSSRDGVHWTRQEVPRPPVLPLGPAGAWDSSMIYTSNQPLVEGDTIKLYYGGFDATHAIDKAKAAIGLATMRKDGFASIDAGSEEGMVVTAPLRNSGAALAVNYTVRDGGVLRIEVLDENNAVIKGYGREDCVPFSGDSVDEPVRWKTKNALPEGSENIRLRFLLRNASLYSFNAGPQPAVSEHAISAGEMRKARKEAAGRRRRIMYNDDGCDTRPYATPDEFLALRLRQLTGTQVDTICYCTGGGGLFWGHVPKVGEAIGEFVSDSDGQYVKDLCAGLRALEKLGTDPLAEAVKFGHGQGMEVFWSSRMNNVEDSFAPWSHSRLKREHPEWQLGAPADWDKYEMTDPRKWWAAFDFAVPEVRAHMLRIFEDVFTRYDIDGIDMDWFRHPRFFRETTENRSVTPEHVAMMTDFVRSVRGLADRIGALRGRPILISCRVGLGMACCRSIGLDVETWLEEGLVDMLVFGGDLGPMSMAHQLREMVAQTHNHTIPAFANLCGSGLQPAHGYHTKEAWYGAAMNAWQCGVDGIYAFNLFPAEPVEQYSHMGSPDTLKGLDKIYAIDSIEARDLWGFDRAAVFVPDRLPITLVPNTVAKAILPVGEDIAGNVPESKVPHALLRVRVVPAAQGDQLRVTLNGIDLGAAKPEEALAAAPTPVWFQLIPPLKDIHPGENAIEIRLDSSRTGNTPTVMDRLELNVSYKGEVKQ